MSEMKARAAVVRLANTLARLVTNANILSAAVQVGVSDAVVGSSRVQKLEGLLIALLSDGRRRTTASDVIHALVMEAHSRTLRKLVEMTDQQVDEIVSEMRLLSIPTGDLALKGWRKGLTKPSAPQVVAAAPLAHVQRGEPVAKVHEGAQRHIVSLTQDGGSPQLRGRQLEHILFSVLKEERLDPELHVTSPGEELDVVFALGDLHGVTECKWTNRPIGLPEVRLLVDKARTKFEGTFGVVLSMSGFVPDINDKVAMGNRQNSVGLDARHLMAVLEGRTTWAKLVRDARKLASRQTGIFYRPFGT